MERGRPLLVPASLVRMRRFICCSGGLAVKPWATPPEVLDALHDLMARRRGDDGFWRSLGSLLDSMSGDLGRRVAARDGGTVDNEVLDPGEVSTLLAEIRAALDGERRGRGSFRRLARALSVPAAGLLVVLGGAIALGCESTQRLEGDADSAADAPVDTAADTTADTPHDTPADTPVDTPVDTPHDTAVDDAPCDAGPDCPHGCAALGDIVEECITDADRRQFFMECLDALDASWRTGLRDLFECESCGDISFQLECCLWNGAMSYCSSPGTAGTFDVDEFLDNCGCYLYLAVRLD